MKDDNLSDVHKLPKRSECRCSCHNDIGGYSAMHVMPCCEPDDNLVIKFDDMTNKAVKLFKETNLFLERNPVNCPHRIAMDIYCEKCEQFNPPMTAEQLLEKRNVGTVKPVEWSVLQKDIWNAAIEAAAKQADSTSPFDYIASAIRSLKK